MNNPLEAPHSRLAEMLPEARRTEYDNYPEFSSQRSAKYTPTIYPHDELRALRGAMAPVTKPEDLNNHVNLQSSKGSRSPNQQEAKRSTENEQPIKKYWWHACPVSKPSTLGQPKTPRDISETTKAPVVEKANSLEASYWGDKACQARARRETTNQESTQSLGKASNDILDDAIKMLKDIHVHDPKTTDNTKTSTNEKGSLSSTVKGGRDGPRKNQLIDLYGEFTIKVPVNLRQRDKPYFMVENTPNGSREVYQRYAHRSPQEPCILIAKEPWPGCWRKMSIVLATTVLGLEQKGVVIAGGCELIGPNALARDCIPRVNDSSLRQVPVGEAVSKPLPSAAQEVVPGTQELLESAYQNNTIPASPTAKEAGTNEISKDQEPMDQNACRLLYGKKQLLEKAVSATKYDTAMRIPFGPYPHDGFYQKCYGRDHVPGKPAPTIKDTTKDSHITQGSFEKTDHHLPSTVNVKKPTPAKVNLASGTHISVSPSKPTPAPSNSPSQTPASPLQQAHSTMSATGQFAFREVTDKIEEEEPEWDVIRGREDEWDTGKVMKVKQHRDGWLEIK